MTDTDSGVATTSKRLGGFRPLAGRYPSSVSSSRTLTLARLRAQRDLKHALRRLGAFLRDPATPIDDVYIRALAQLADRVGLPRVTAQTVDATSASVTFERKQVQVGGTVSADDALDFVSHRIEILRAARTAIPPETAEVADE